MSKKFNIISDDGRSRNILAEVIDALHDERAAIDRLIEATESLAANQRKREGRTAIRLREAKRRSESPKVVVFAAREIA